MRTVTIESPSSRNGGRTNATSTVPSFSPAAGWLSPAFETCSSTLGMALANSRIVSLTTGTDRRPREADPQRRPLGSKRRVELRHPGIERRQRRDRMRQEPLARLRQADPAGRALEQLDPETGLQLLDLR